MGLESGLCEDCRRYVPSRRIDGRCDRCGPINDDPLQRAARDRRQARGNLAAVAFFAGLYWAAWWLLPLFDPTVLDGPIFGRIFATAVALFVAVIASVFAAVIAGTALVWLAVTARRAFWPVRTREIAPARAEPGGLVVDPARARAKAFRLSPYASRRARQ